MKVGSLALALSFGAFSVGGPIRLHGPLAAAGTGCATVVPEPVRSPKPQRARVAQPPPVPAFHWEPLEVSVDPSIERAPLPISEEDWTLLGGAAEELRSLPRAARDAIAQRGFAVIGQKEVIATFGELYRAIDERELPTLLTLDALSEMVHLAVDAALTEVDRATVEPTLRSLLARWGTRLDAMSGRVPTDLVRPLRFARGIVAVASALLDDDARARAPAEIADAVRDEVRRVRESFPAAKSALLEVPLDYGAISSASARGSDARRRPVADAIGWLSTAPFVLAGRETQGGTGVGVALSRDHTRAALLFAHVTHPTVDKDAAAEWARLDAIESFLVGPADDWSPAELGALASREGVDVTSVAALVDVARIDRVRKVAAQSYRARVHDGGGAPSGVALEDQGLRFVSRFVAPTARVMGARLALDAIVQQALVSPVVGGYRGDRTVVTLANGKRTLSRPLDLAIVLGSDEARAALRSDGDDAYEEFDSTLRKLVLRKPPEREASRHASVYLSLLDLVGVLISPSAADAAVPAAAHVEHKKRMLECALVTYASMRHDFTARSRSHERFDPPADGRRGKAPRVFVEPHPEAIGRMVALVRQLARGLAAYKTLDESGSAAKIVASVERLLTTAFQAALLAANGIAPNDDQAKALASMFDTIASLERATGSRAARGVDMHVDLGSGRVLMQGTGGLAEILLLVRDPRDGKHVLTFGAVASHHELVHVRQEAVGDVEWQARLARGALPRAAWTTGYRFAR